MSKKQKLVKPILPVYKALSVVLWPIDKPTDYPQNARTWKQKAVEKVGVSIREFGFRQPIVALILLVFGVLSKLRALRQLQGFGKFDRFPVGINKQFVGHRKVQSVREISDRLG